MPSRPDNEQRRGLNILMLSPTLGLLTMRSCRTLQRTALITALFLCSQGASIAQSGTAYPAKPIRFVVPFAAGGGTDALTRIVGDKLADSMGRPVIVDNRPGAAGAVGADIVAKAAPDGYTLMMILSSHVINPSLYKKLPYDTINDFSPVIMVNAAPRMLVINPAVPARNLKELIAYGKANSGRMNYASGGVGTLAQLSAEMLGTFGGFKMVHLPYKGGGPLLIALLANEAQLTFGSPSTVLPHVKTGRLRALGTTSAKRSALMPDVPTIHEAGVPGYEAVEWNAVLAPARTPAAIIARLNKEIQLVLERPDIRKTLAELGNEGLGGTSEHAGRYLRSEMAKYAGIVKAAGIQPE